MNKRLGRQEWIDAALLALSQHGIDGVRVERLAETLKVTKGSFYWHFADRNALLEALLIAWKARATGDIIAMVETRGGNAGQRLRTLARAVFNADGRLDRQIRAWAANDPVAWASQDEIDRLRMSYLEGLFEQLGFSPVEASARATFSYHALIGQFTMGADNKPKPEELEIVLRMLLGEN